MLALVAGLLPAGDAAAAPTNTVAPAVSGTPADGQLLTATDGTWTGTGTVTTTRRWQRCDYTGQNCVNLAATGTTYTVASADVGSTLRVVVTGTDTTGSAAAASPVTAVVTGNVPANTVAPTITGTTRQGQTLTGTTGTWTGSTPITYAYAWLRCDAAGGSCSAIGGATASTYVLQAADVASTIRVRLTATNPAGSTQASSLQSAAIAPAAPPVNTVLPTISGTARDGQTLTSTTGTWTGTATITYARQWQRCNSSGGACANVSATGASYALTAADVGSTVRVVVTATNPDGSSSATSAVSAVVAVNPPGSSAAPAVSGSTRAGQALTTTNGTWSGTAPLTYAYAWYRCDSGGAGCVAIGGATATTYTLQVADVGSTVRSEVTATNAGGSASRQSNATAVIGPAQPPVNTVAPTVTGTARDGQTLTAVKGTWTGIATISYAYSWERCNAAGASCASLGVTATTYAATPADVGSTLRVVVTATNPDGVASASSAVTAVVAAAAPASTALPVVSGTARDGLTLTATTGTWTGTPTITYATAWERCDSSGGSCAAISGATGSSYVVVPADIGGKLRAVVTATNAAGSTVANSAVTALVAAAPPANTVAPSFSGTVRDGQTLLGDQGTWTGTAPLTFTWQWRRCNASGAACTSIGGATGASYTLTSADVGQTIRFQATATNGAGSVAATSAQSIAVAAAPPASTVAPAITGTLTDGQVLTASTGTFTGTTPLTYVYAWQRCAPAGGSCTAITGATSATYTAQSADVGRPLRVVVTATNGAGTAQGTSAETAQIAAVPPANTILPSISGTPRDGLALSAIVGTWTGTTPQTRTYQWRRCDAAGASCADIVGATGSTYTAVAADVESTIRVVVTSTNPAASVSATSDRTALVGAAPPVGTVLPAITGTPRDGQTLTADPGGWTGTPTITFEYQWRRCTTTCVDIVGAVNQTYVLSTADVAATIRVFVTASNDGGYSTQLSPATGSVLPYPPTSTALPVITGVVRDGDVVTSSQGSWTGVVPIVVTYRWWRCDTNGDFCSVIPDATAYQYQLTPTDVGLTLRVEAIGTNAGGSTSAFSDHSQIGQPTPPVNVHAPSVTGKLGVGRTITVDVGTWQGSPPLVHTYQWQRCEAEGVNCVDVVGATGPGYLLVPADLGAWMRVHVRVTNAAGMAEVDSGLSTREVRNDPPANDVAAAVVVDPVAAQGIRLSVDLGEWHGFEPMSPAYQWLRCDTLGDSCSPIAGATQATYLPTADDVGSTIRVVVTMENDVGYGSSTTVQTLQIQQPPPANTIKPVITGTPKPGTDLTTTTGTWVGGDPIAYETSWLRCDEEGANCVTILDASGLKYTLRDDDVGHTVRARVAATNPTMTATRDSDPTGVVIALVPANTAKPTVGTIESGVKARQGVDLIGAGGTWTGTSPMTFTYQWQRCASATDCSDIPGATGLTYTLTAEDVARRVRLLVVATNVGGKLAAASVPTDTVAGLAPTASTKPRVSGSPLEGSELVADPGTWSGTGSLSYAYQWKRCDSGGGECKQIPKATQRTYVVGTEDVGMKLSVLVTAKNAIGKADAESATTEEVAAVKPRPKTRPSIRKPVADLAAGVKLELDTGTWTGSQPITFEYQWLRCAPGGRECAEIDGATAESYTLEESDLQQGKPALAGSLRVTITATNKGGKAVATTKAFGAPAPAARVKVTPQMVGWDRSNRLTVTITCAERGLLPCTGKLAVESTPFTRKVAYRVLSGQARVYTLPLTKAEKKAARAAGVFDAKVTVTERLRNPVTRPLTLQLPKLAPTAKGPRKG